MSRAFLIPLLVLSACSSDVERVQGVGPDKADYRRSPCACFQIHLKPPGGEEVLRRALILERALG